MGRASRVTNGAPAGRAAPLSSLDPPRALSHRDHVSTLAPGRPRRRYLLAVLLAGAALFSMDVLRASAGHLSWGIIGLSFASALIKFVLWGAAATLVWRLLEWLPVDHPRRLRALGLHLAASVVVPTTISLASHLLQSRVRRGLLDALPLQARTSLVDSWTGVPGSELGVSLAMSLPWDLLSYWVLFSGVAFWQWAVRARERERYAHELAGHLNRAHLHALEAQLRPHFLFNALNSISALLAREPATARAITRGLRRLFGRLLAAERAPLHRLADELAFLGDYIDIQRARFGERLQVEITVEPGCQDALIPSLLLQPLVENAIRHAADQRVGRTRIRVAARREPDRLHVEVHDDGPGSPTPRSPGRGEGIGLRNTRERLRHLYGANHAFLFEGRASPWGGARVTLSVPILPHTAGPAPVPHEQPDPLKESASSRPRWLVAWALFLAAMAVLNVIWSAARFYVHATPEGRFGDVLLAGARGGAAHVLLFPLVYAANRRLIRALPGFWSRLLMHASLALALSLAKSTLVRCFCLLLGGSAPSIVAMMGVRIYSDLLHYALMAALCHALDRYSSMREQAERAATLERALATRLKAIRSSIDPDVLLATLARIEATVEPAPLEADRLVASLGDRLRESLRESALPGAGPA
jgi:two-component system LytT family sensor kinase